MKIAFCRLHRERKSCSIYTQNFHLVSSADIFKKMKIFFLNFMWKTFESNLFYSSITLRKIRKINGHLRHFENSTFVQKIFFPTFFKSIDFSLFRSSSKMNSSTLDCRHIADNRKNLMHRSSRISNATQIPFFHFGIKIQR